MKSYICINGQKIELTKEQADQLRSQYGPAEVKLADVAVGQIVQIGEFEMVVLEHTENGTALILKGFYGEDTAFGEDNNDYRQSLVDQRCGEFAKELAEIVGDGNVVNHAVDLTSDDGLKDYGAITRRASLLTAERYRRYVDIMDTVNPKEWWWLATAHSTKRHENDTWAKCVAPSGGIGDISCVSGNGVRPFCILKSNIFVSK